MRSILYGPRHVRCEVSRSSSAAVPWLEKGTIRALLSSKPGHEEKIMRSGLLWLIGVPIPIIIILWLLTGHL